MKRYFAKPDTWFKEGTECFRGEEIYPAGWTFDKNGVSHASATYTGIYIVGSSEDSLKEELPEIYEECGGKSYDDYWYDKGYQKGDEVEMHELCCDSEFIVESEE